MARGFASGWKIATLFGLEVRIHPSWLLIFFLLTFSLASYVLPMSDIARGGPWWNGEAEVIRYMTQRGVNMATAEQALRSWPDWEYWVLGAVGAIGLFICVLAHEMSHSLVAKANGIPVEGITLFIFGGVSRLKDEANSPGVEFKVAIAGPLMSLVIGLGCFVVYVLLGEALLPQALALIFYFALINTMLAVFNLIPGFPLDGGRVLRSLLWKVYGSFQQATAVAARIGEGIGMAMIVGGGLMFFFAGLQFGWLWIAFIGLFLRYAAQSSYQQVAIREGLSGLTVRDILQEQVISVAPDLTVEQLVDDYFYRYRFRSFPVLESGRFIGMIGLKDVQGIPRGTWGRTTVRQAMHQVAEENLIHPSDDLIEVFRKMMSEDKGHLPVVDDGRLSGIVTRHDIMNLLHIRTDLGAGAGAEGRSRT